MPFADMAGGADDSAQLRGQLSELESKLEAATARAAAAEREREEAKEHLAAANRGDGKVYVVSSITPDNKQWMK